MGRKSVVKDVITSMTNKKAKSMLELSIVGDETVDDILTSIRSAIVVSSISSKVSGIDKDNALLAISSESEYDDGFKQDINTAIMYINTNYKEF